MSSLSLFFTEYNNVQFPPIYLATVSGVSFAKSCELNRDSFPLRSEQASVMDTSRAALWACFLPSALARAPVFIVGEQHLKLFSHGISFLQGWESLDQRPFEVK